MYFVFAGTNYYPRGGFGDYVGVAETLEGAEAILAQLDRPDWSEIVLIEGASHKVVE